MMRGPRPTLKVKLIAVLKQVKYIPFGNNFLTIEKQHMTNTSWKQNIYVCRANKMTKQYAVTHTKTKNWGHKNLPKLCSPVTSISEKKSLQPKMQFR